MSLFSKVVSHVNSHSVAKQCDMHCLESNVVWRKELRTIIAVSILFRFSFASPAPRLESIPTFPTLIPLLILNKTPKLQRKALSLKKNVHDKTCLTS